MKTPRTKVSITLPADLHKRVEEAGHGNLSEFLTRAAQEKLLNDAMREYHRLRDADGLDDVYEAAEADAA